MDTQMVAIANVPREVLMIRDESSQVIERTIRILEMSLLKFSSDLFQNPELNDFVKSIAGS